tara:strand:- start:658 stop:1269 length:612 start_codon:yes stop_codon:yes gene_type:complete
MKLINSIVRIFKEYKIYILIIIFFEIYYFLKNYKGFKISYSKNQSMADNIPCPYYFLFKINKFLKKRKFNSVIDLGCGSGRIINFINNKYQNKKITGIEYFNEQYNYAKEIFKKSKNISIKKLNFIKINFSKKIYDVYFLSAPFKKKKDFLQFMNKLAKINKIKKRIIIIINYDKKLINKVKKLRFINSFYLSKEKGYSICIL